MKKLKYRKGKWESVKLAGEDQKPATINEIKKWFSDVIDNTIESGEFIEDYYVILIDKDSDDPRTVAIVGNGPTSEHISKLIAAAPDMLEQHISNLQNIGKWLSAALGDDTVCKEMKDDINLFFKSFSVIEKATGLSSDEVL